MSISQKYKQLQKDIKYIEDKYGLLSDYCGGWCECDKFQDLLSIPTYSTAFDIQLDYLECLFNGRGTETHNLNNEVDSDKKLKKIKEKWLN